MPNPKHLPHLIKLLEDESDIVQQSVLDELSSFGPSLEKELRRLNIAPDADQFRTIRQRLEEHNRKWLRNEWPRWFDIEHDKLRLEAALTLLADFQNGRNYPVKLPALLNQVADEFLSTHKPAGARELSSFLFRIKGLGGAQTDYYNPLNSNLVYVLEHMKGIPISLACIYMLVGHRLGIPIEGINTPGHFLAKATIENKPYLVDCFNGGRFLDKLDLVSLNSKEPIRLENILKLECDANTIVARFLRNLVNAYQESDNSPNVAFMAELLELMTAEDGEEAEE